MVVACAAGNGQSTLQHDCGELARSVPGNYNFTTAWDYSKDVCFLACSLTVLPSPCFSFEFEVLAVFDAQGISSNRSVCDLTATPTSDKPTHVNETCPEWELNIYDMTNWDDEFEQFVRLDMKVDLAVEALKSYFELPSNMRTRTASKGMAHSLLVDTEMGAAKDATQIASNETLPSDMALSLPKMILALSKHLNSSSQHSSDVLV